MAPEVTPKWLPFGEARDAETQGKQMVFALFGISFWPLSGAILGSISGPILGPFWAPFWDHFWATFGSVLAQLYGKSWKSMEIHWKINWNLRKSGKLEKVFSWFILTEKFSLKDFRNFH